MLTTNADRRVATKCGGDSCVPGTAERKTTLEWLTSTTAHRSAVLYLHAFQLDTGGRETCLLTVAKDGGMILWKMSRDGSAASPVATLCKSTLFCPSAFCVGASPIQVYLGDARAVTEWNLGESIAASGVGGVSAADRVEIGRGRVMRVVFEENDANSCTALAYLHRTAGWLAAGLSDGDIFIFGPDGTEPFLKIQQNQLLTRCQVLPFSLFHRSCEDASPPGTGKSFLFGSTTDYCFRCDLPDRNAPSASAALAQAGPYKDKDDMEARIERRTASPLNLEVTSGHQISATNCKLLTLQAAGGGKTQQGGGGDKAAQVCIAGLTSGQILFWAPNGELWDGVARKIGTTGTSAPTQVDLIDEGTAGSGHRGATLVAGFVSGRLQCFDIETATLTSQIKFPTAIVEAFVYNRGIGGGSDHVLFGCTTKRAFVFQPVIEKQGSGTARNPRQTPAGSSSLAPVLGGAPLKCTASHYDVHDLELLVAAYRDDGTPKMASRGEGGHSLNAWMEKGSSSYDKGDEPVPVGRARCSRYEGIRGGIQCLVLTPTHVCCGTSYGGVAAFVRAEEEHDDHFGTTRLKKDTSAGMLGMLAAKAKLKGKSSALLAKQAGSRKRQISRSESKKRAASDTDLLGDEDFGDYRTILHNVDTAEIAHWWSVDLERVLYHLTPTGGSVAWKQIKEGVVAMNDTLQLMGFAWTIRNSAAAFPDIAPSVGLSFVIGDLGVMYPSLALMTETMFTISLIFPTIFVLTMIGHHSIALLWRIDTPWEDGWARFDVVRRVGLKFLLFSCWVTSTVLFMPSMKLLLDPLDCCFPEPFSYCNISIGNNKTFCFSPAENARKTTAILILAPLVATYACRLRRLGGHANLMSTSVFDWNTDLFELEMQDEMIFSIRNGNLLNRGFISIVALLLFFSVWGQVYPKVLLCIYTLAAILIIVLFHTLQPYYDARVNAARIALQVVVLCSNVCALIYMFIDDPQDDQGPILVLYCSLPVVLIGVYFAYHAIYPVNHPCKQLPDCAREVKLLSAKLQAGHLETRRAAALSASLLAKTKTNIPPLSKTEKETETFSDSARDAYDPVEAQASIEVLKLICCSDPHQRDAFWSQKGISIISLSLHRHLEHEEVIFECMDWLACLLRDQDHAYREHLLDTENSVFNAAAYSGRVSDVKSGLLSSTVFLDCIKATEKHRVEEPGLAMLAAEIVASLAFDVKKSADIGQAEVEVRYLPSPQRAMKMHEITAGKGDEEFSLQACLPKWLDEGEEWARFMPAKKKTHFLEMKKVFTAEGMEGLRESLNNTQNAQKVRRKSLSLKAVAKAHII